MAEESWRILLFGKLQAQREPKTLLQFSARRLGALLACLVLRAPHPVSREELLALLWPDGEPEASRNRLRVLLSNLRAELEPASISSDSVLLVDRTTAQLKPSAFTSDYHDFLQALQAASSTSEAAGAIACLQNALTLYRGKLLEGYYDDWILAERSRIAELRNCALRNLARRLAQCNQLEIAVEYARQAVAAEPMDEEAHCDLMRLYGEIGQPSAGLRQYEQLKRLLHEEVRAEPSEAVQVLAAELEAKLGHGAIRTKRIVRPMGLRAPERVAQEQKRGSDLPVRLNRFFGRVQEVALLRSLLSLDGSTRLVSLVGTGGIGKTRLAIEAAEQLCEAYGWRAYFVSLADVLDPNEIGRAIAGALRLSASPGIDLLSQAMAALSQAPSLLILDNLEQITPDAAPQVEWLLTEVRSLRCLVTSRRTLGVEGEREIALGPLPLPQPDVGVEQLSAYSGVALFADRAHAVRPDFAVTTRNAADVVQLCYLLEGLPLAIELAAARSRVMTPGEMRAQTGKLIHWLVDVRGGKVARHRSLTATLEWSYRLLAPGDRRCFDALAVFADGFTAEAAGAVALVEGAAPLDALTMLEHLSDASMLTAMETSEAKTRFGMLEMLREFGQERLEKTGEEAEIRGRHLAYFTEFVRRQVGPSSKWNPDELARIATEDANLRTSLEYGLRPEANEEEQCLVLDLASRMSGYWEVQGRLSEGRAYLRRAIALPGAPETQEARINALRGAGVLSTLLGDHEEARSFLQAGSAQAKNCAYPRGLAGCVSGLGSVAFALGDYSEARAHYQESLDVYREIDDWSGIAACLSELGNVAFYLGDHGEAQERLEAALALYRGVDDCQGIASVLLRLGNVFRNQNYYVEGRVRLEEALKLFREAGNKQGVASALQGLGLVAMLQNDYSNAYMHYTNALNIFREIGYLRGAAACLHYLGRVTLDRGDYVESLAHSTEALDLCRKTGDRRIMAACLSHLGDLASEQSDYAEALTRFTEALEVEQEIGSPLGIAMCLGGLGRLAIKQNDPAEAHARLSAALQIGRDTGVRLLVAGALQSYAYLAQRNGQWERATRLAGAASSIRNAIGTALYAAEEQRHQELLAKIRAELGEVESVNAWNAGEALSADEAIEEALSEFHASD